LNDYVDFETAFFQKFLARGESNREPWIEQTSYIGTRPQTEKTTISGSKRDRGKFPERNFQGKRNFFALFTEKENPSVYQKSTSALLPGMRM